MDLHELADELRAAAERRVHFAIVETMELATADLAARAQQNVSERLKERSRSLLSSVRHELVEAHGEVHGIVSAGGSWQGLEVPYARLQEYGGTVLPVKGKFLAIPVGPALNSIGLAKYRSARDAPGLVYVQSLKGQPLLVKLVKGSKGEAPRVEVWYVLRQSVTLPARRYLRDAWSAVLAELPARLADSAARALAAA